MSPRNNGAELELDEELIKAMEAIMMVAMVKPAKQTVSHLAMAATMTNEVI